MDRIAFMGRRIKEARQTAGLTQTELATALGFGTSWLGEIESGRNGMDAIDLYNLARYLKHPLEFFLDPAFEPRLPGRPTSLFEWRALYPGDQIRANLHFQLDNIDRAATAES